MNKEVVHIMLKPETLEGDMREIILGELLEIGGRLISSKRVILDMYQISEIYNNFRNERAKPVVFKYFTSKETEHLAFVGTKGIHKKYQNAKGKPGAGGIRGKYYTKYTKLSQEDVESWLEGTLVNIEDIDLEMFARDILHVPNSTEDSKRGLLSVFDESQISLIRDEGIIF